MSLTEPPRCGQIVLISLDSLIGRGLVVRVIGHDVYGSTPGGCVWLDGYVLDRTGNATERRRMFLQLHHLTVLHAAATRADTRARLVRAARNTGPVTIPHQRKPSTTGGIR